MISDLIVACRGLRRTPAFTVAASGLTLLAISVLAAAAPAVRAALTDPAKVLRRE